MKNMIKVKSTKASKDEKSDESDNEDLKKKVTKDKNPED